MADPPPEKSGAASADAGFAAPKINPPKGGGAIRGIDEKFTANPATGTGALTVPIVASPSRSGFAPQLSLSYDSGSGNGAFGLGWSLSLTSITRRTDKGLPRYDDEAESDIFLLSGAEDLVPLMERDALGNWVEQHLPARDGFAIKAYRPRTEGLFARIERWTRLDDGATHWRSISRENLLTLYGIDAQSRIADPRDPNHIFSWLISRSYDDKGNAMIYEYAEENGRGVDLRLPSEQHRERHANRYIKRLRYGNREPMWRDERDPERVHWMFSMVFDYGEGHYLGHEPDENGRRMVEASFATERDWAVRRDPFSTFRAGFEVRTYRLCRRILMFHHFPEELGVEDALVRSTELRYREKPSASFVERIEESGHALEKDGRYLTRLLPPLELSYTASPLEDPEFQDFELKDVDERSLANLAGGIDGKNYRWLDLDGEGISGVLTEQDGAWFYKPNLGGGRFGPTEAVRTQPSTARLNEGRQQLLDVEGEGRLDLVDFAPAVAGFYERTMDGGWRGLHRFRSLPVLDWRAPNLRFVDLTGDGVADILITEDDAFTWHASLLEEGFGHAVRVSVPMDDDAGPRVIFSDTAELIALADMSGDGLSDIVRVRNGQVCYWPNLGYGLFGAKIEMDDAPWFEEPDQFDQRRIRFSDTDGSGTSDIVYLGRNGVRIYLNQAGNAWSRARVIEPFPRIDSAASIEVTDFLGRGTSCLLWSSPLPRDGGRQLRYLDLMRGVKPHLLERVRNAAGAETRIGYGTSTEFYLADKAAGTPWVTRLPFPVHVVKRVEIRDEVSGNRFVTRYSFHHGFYDGLEREFRGFGRTDQIDTEEIESLTPDAGGVSTVPPVLTKTWTHTGVFLGIGEISRHLAHEYYRGDENGQLNDSILPEGVTPFEAREACRALKGSVLRREIYALDGTAKQDSPYTVSETNYTIAPMQPKRGNRYAVFFTHPREKIDLHYERDPRDPRVTHTLMLAVDEYGDVLQSAAIAYRRREPEFNEQTKTLATWTESRYTNVVDQENAHRTPAAADARTFELTSPALCSVHPLDFAVVQKIVAQAHEIPYEATASQAKTEKRLIERRRTQYRKDDLSELLPVGRLETMALPGEVFKQAFTSGGLEVFSAKESVEAMKRLLTSHEAGYRELDGDGVFWIPGGCVFFSPEKNDTLAGELAFAREHFFLPHRFEDPFGHLSQVAYDHLYNLNVVRTRDAVGNETQSETDYRVLQPRCITDPNGNRTESRFDALGMLAGTVICGKANGAIEGDSFGHFEPDLTPKQISRFFDSANPYAAAIEHLGTASSRIIYDFNRLPVCSASILRETHVSALAPGEQTRVQLRFVYADGFGREAQTRIQAEPGPLRPDDPNSRVIDPRWVATGAKIYNNKGKPVRQYEPFFSAAPQYGIETWGVSNTLFYDPAERVVVTLHPNQTYEKVVFNSWRQFTYDVNDTVTFDPKTDPEAGEFFCRIPDSDYLPTWFDQRIGGALGAAEKSAAEKAARDANTPNVVHFDTMGRIFLTVSDNGKDASGREQFFRTRKVMDIEGNQRALIDALDRTIARYDFDMLGTRIHQASMEAGERWMLHDVVGKPVCAWNNRDYFYRTEYDGLRRPARAFVRGGSGGQTFAREILVERTIWGDSPESGLTPAEQRQSNLRTKVFQHFDGSGVVHNELYDFKGNLLNISRQFASDYKNQPDWSASPALETEVFSSITAYDALNRVIATTAPDHSTYRAIFNDASLLEAVQVNLRGAQQDGEPVWTSFVDRINYDAKSQRSIVQYSNGATTSYEYDAKTYRLIRLKTTRQAAENGVASRIFKGAGIVQDRRYTYDPVGNITRIEDHAAKRVFHKNQQVDAACDYRYDPLYRLIEATGREQIGQAAFDFHPNGGDFRDYPFKGAASLGDLEALRNFTETFEYDAVSNFLKASHRAVDGNWTREYRYHEASPLEPDKVSNRLSETTLDPDSNEPPERYSYDVNGNITRMPHLPKMEWNFDDHLLATSRQVVNDGAAETTYYVYDGNGQRVRKVTERQGGRAKTDHFYINGFEVHRDLAVGGAVELERQTLHVMDDKQRVALVETKIIAGGSAIEAPRPAMRFQLANYLHSSILELNETGALITYEEYSPYGNTTYQAAASAAELSLKRYRYSGKERDDENGFTYHGARYYASWIGRWTQCDPRGIADAPNLYQYGKANPIRLIDPNGKQVADPDGVVRTPGTTSASLLRMKDGTMKLLPAPETSLATDPAFQKVAQEVRAGMTSTSYESFRATLNDRIKQILQGAEASPLKQILEVKNGTLFWKPGTAFAGQELNYAHTIARQSITNLGANEAAKIALENLEPVGRDFHLKVYGHPEEVATQYMKLATDEARAGTRAMANELASETRIPRAGRNGQAGFTTVGGMIMLAVVIGVSLYVVSNAKDKPKAIVEMGANFAVGALVFKLAGGGGIGFVASLFIGMYSDNAEMNRQHAIEERKEEIAKDFIRSEIPGAWEDHWYGDSFDSDVLDQVKKLLFETQPTELK